MNILIVDDNEDGRLILRATLAAAGHSISEAATGRAALDMARRDPPELIISDILMPEMDGFQLCREVRGDAKLKDIPFVFYTATYTDEKDERLARDLGADRFIRKPMDGDGFLAAIQNVTRAVEHREIGVTDQTQLHETTFLKRYNARLVEKLEKKLTELENEILARKEAEDRLARLLEAIPDMILLMDEQGRFLDFKPAATFAPLMPADQFLGRTAGEVLPPELAEKTLAKIQEVLGRGTAVTFEYQLSFQGQQRDFESRLKPFGKGLVLAVIRDVTEMHHLRQQFLQAQKMESIGHLAGGVAHDFNNMLSVILGYSELVMVKLNHDDPLRPEIREILKAAGRSAELVKQLLAFARKQTIKPQPLNLNLAVSDNVKMLTRLLGEDIQLKIKPGRELWEVMMDPAQVTQIITNLAINARDAIAGTGIIIIETANRVFDEAYCRMNLNFQPGEYVQLTVSDTGMGMDREVMTSIFEPFFTTKEEGRGTGLGLSTVYGIVKQNNGFINVYSEQHLGSTFNIYLPRHTAGAAALPKVLPERSPASGRETILIVEDLEMILNLCKKVLAAEGYQVLAASTPGEALYLCENHSGEISLLLTDVVMPDMNGKELHERITAVRPAMRALFMSGYTADIITGRGVLPEGMHFIQKPFTPLDLTAKVREVLDT